MGVAKSFRDLDVYQRSLTAARDIFVLSQAFPQLLEAADILPIHGYPTELLEHLRRFALNAVGFVRAPAL